MQETLVTKKVSLVLHPIMIVEIDNKERILAAARQLLMRYGIRSVSMDDIANEVGMSKKTIYQLYTDKEALVKEIFTEFLVTNKENCTCEKQSAENAVHEMIITMDMVSEMYKAMNASLLYDLQKYHPRVFVLVQDFKQSFLHNEIMQNLIRGQEEKLYRDDIDIETLTRYRLETMFLNFTPAFQKDLNATHSETHSQIMLHFLYGLVTPKGYDLIKKYQNENPSS